MRVGKRLAISGVVEMWQLDRRRRDDEGAAAVEFALVLPVLALLLLGIVEFGLVFNAQLTVTQAAREGARVASVGGDVAESVSTQTSGLKNVHYTATSFPGGSTGGSYVVVTVWCDRPIDALQWAGWSKTPTLHSTAQMRKEN